MYEDLKKQAVENLKKERLKKRSVYTVGLIFGGISVILYAISFNFAAYVAYWIKFPILILAFVYAIIYFSTFGFPFMGDTDELTDEEIEREIVKIYKLQGSQNSGTAEEIEELELREIEELKNKWEDGEEYV